LSKESIEQPIRSVVKKNYGSPHAPHPLPPHGIGRPCLPLACLISPRAWGAGAEILYAAYSGASCSRRTGFPALRVGWAGPISEFCSDLILLFSSMRGYVPRHTPYTGLFSLRSPSCLAQAHRCLSSLQSYRGTARSWGQLLRASFLGQIRIAQIIPVEIV
jgi:hypothetical protein